MDTAENNPRIPRAVPRPILRKRTRGRRPSVLMIAMPWQALNWPSIQLGTLQSLLRRAGIHTEVCSLWLTFMEHCLAATAHRPDDQRIQLRDYEMVSETRFAGGLGDWIFAVPPFREAPVDDEAYLAYVRGHGMSEPEIAKVLIMRSLVPAFLEHCATEILAPAPQVIGFSSTFSQNVPSLALAKLLKQRNPSVEIVFGGANCDGPMGAALHRAFPWIDVVVRGEAERVLPNLVRDLLAGGPIRPQPGLCYREGQRSIAVDLAAGDPVSMDEVPTPIFDEYFERLEKTSFRTEIMTEIQLPYESARGCWWGAKSHCTFCGLNGTSMAFRSKKPDRVVAELLELARNYRVLDLQVADNILDLRYFREVLPRLRDGGYDLSIFYETKANLTREQVRLMREAGVNRIQPGIESLSTPILRLMRKGITAFQNVRLLKWCAEYGIRVYWNVLYGLPGEPPEELTRMADVVPSLTHLEPPRLFPLWLDRFSPYHDRPADFGLEQVGPMPWYRFVYPVEPALLADLAYSFDHRYVDGRDPEAYIEPLRRAIRAWQGGGAAAYRSLRYRRGPGFLVVRDRRPGLETADYSFGEREARLYLACEDGATALEAADAVRAAGIADIGAEDAQEYLDALAAMRLVYKGDGRYLAPALPAALREQAGDCVRSLD